MSFKSNCDEALRIISVKIHSSKPQFHSIQREYRISLRILKSVYGRSYPEFKMRLRVIEMSNEEE